MFAGDTVKSAFLFSALVGLVSGFCREHEFMCDGHRCLPGKWLCDGDPDCADGSDEQPENCLGRSGHRLQRECQSHEFECGNHNCIPLNWKCDGHDDCRDGSDEVEEICSKCAPGEFQCVSDDQCISGEWQCNSVPDCEDGSDEADCATAVTTPAPPGTFLCDNGRQIPYRWACDGQDDCLDGSDERSQNCGNEASSTPTPGPPALCMEGEVQCGLTCIMESWVCDGKADCEGAQDERDCPDNCPETHFKCTNAGCVPKLVRCDGTAHCMDSSDEEDCLPQPPESNSTCNQTTHFECWKGKCISQQSLCDGVDDCIDSEDESAALCGEDECQEKNGGCEHLCVNTRESYFCQCQDGYRLTGKFNCEDINECVETPGSCSQLCTNTEGGFHCSCLPGYRRDPGNYTRCKADSGDTYLIFSHSYDIRSLRLRDGELTTLIRDARRATALDFQYSSNQIFWGDNKDNRIMRADMTNPEGAVVLLKGEQLRVDGLAVDWIHNNIYYTDVSAFEVRMISWDGLWTRTIVTEKLDQPRAIAVNPIDGYVYWTDWGNSPKIERSGLDGSNRVALVSAPHVHWPNSITVDYTNKKLYWCDGYFNKIKMSNMDGSHIQTVLYSSQVLRLPFSVTVFEDRVYWVDWSETALFSANKFNGENIEHVSAGHLLEAPRVVHVFHKYRQPSGENVCASHTCSHFCVRSFEGQPVCVCPDGYQLSPTDFSTCYNCTMPNEDTVLDNKLVDPPTIPVFPTATDPGPMALVNTTSPQGGMIFGVVLGCVVVVALAVGVFYGYMKMRKRVIIHTRFPNPVYRKTIDVETDGGGYTIEQDSMMYLQQDYDYTEDQNTGLIDNSEVLLTPKK